MEGIILTRRSGSGGSSESIPVETTIAAGATEIIETYDGSSCPFIRWQVSIADRTSLVQSVQYFVLTVIHDYEGNVEWNLSSKLGSEINKEVTINIFTGSPNTNIIFSLTNEEAHDLDICATKI